MNPGRAWRRGIRPIWMAGLAAVAWTNRSTMRSALGFGKATPARPLTAPDSVTVRTTTATWRAPSTWRRRPATASADRAPEHRPLDKD